MDTISARQPVGRLAGTTASPWSFAFSFWFTYLPPASLVGWEAPMR
jgi:hypothetical protein